MLKILIHPLWVVTVWGQRSVSLFTSQLVQLYIGSYSLIQSTGE